MSDARKQILDLVLAHGGDVRFPAIPYLTSYGRINQMRRIRAVGLSPQRYKDEQVESLRAELHAYHLEWVYADDQSANVIGVFAGYAETDRDGSRLEHPDETGELFSAKTKYMEEADWQRLLQALRAALE